MLSELKKTKKYLDDLYYNTGDSKVTDEQYDHLKESIAELDPDYVPEVGAQIRDGENRVQLPFWLGSADKITDGKTLSRWLGKRNAPSYLISSKLDGISCLLEYKNDELKLYTRGDGIVGADISFLQKYLKLPKIKNDIAVRGELIIPKKVFEKTYKSSYKNPRNMVAGLVNSKTVRDGLLDIHFVVYEIVDDECPKPESQIIKLKRLGFEVVKHCICPKIDIDSLSSLYSLYREEENYELDGLIVQTNIDYTRNKDGNPDYLFAFKMLFQESIRETIVTDIEWNVSKWGQLKPVVIVEPVELGGVTITRASAHNAKFIVDNNLGTGAVIQITRSNEVIPYIVSVLKGVKPQLPDFSYEWDENKVNIISHDSDDEMCIKLISSFFKELGIKHVAEATVRKMYESGLTNLISIISAEKETLRKVPGFGEKSVDRIYESIRKGLKEVTLPKIIGASNVLGYGIGTRKLELLLSELPDFFNLGKDELVDKIVKIKGFSTITADKIVENFENSIDFIQKITPYITIKTQTNHSHNKSLVDQVIVMSGFRNKELEQEIKNKGGEVSNSITNKTTILIVKDKSQITSKIQKAQEKGIKILDMNEFDKLI
jgi:NAD-dependent DNA ligase